MEARIGGFRSRGKIGESHCDRRKHFAIGANQFSIILLGNWTKGFTLNCIIAISAGDIAHREERPTRDRKDEQNGFFPLD